ncbi:RING-type E3 ubiquitin transferase [Psidium guajava]|nr:RING-type E3 ubiquitin transferase [Psidium guajava]
MHQAEEGRLKEQIAGVLQDFRGLLLDGFADKIRSMVAGLRFLCDKKEISDGKLLVEMESDSLGVIR